MRLTEVSFWFSRHFRQDGWSRVPGAISAAMCKECGAECAAGAVRWHGNAWNPPSVHSPSGNDVPAFRPFWIFRLQPEVDGWLSVVHKVAIPGHSPTNSPFDPIKSWAPTHVKLSLQGQNAGANVTIMLETLSQTVRSWLKILED